MIPKKTLSLKRFAAGDYSATTGDWVEGAEDTSENIEASVQPLRGKEMELLPEGRRESQAYKLYTGTQLFTVKTSPTNNPDQIQIDSNWFEVLIVEPWQNTIINHYKVIVVEL